MHTRQRLKTRYLTAMFVWVTTLIIPGAYADIYYYIDKEGVTHFTNTPTSSQYKLYMKEFPPQPIIPRIISKYDHFIDEAAQDLGISFSLLKAMIHVESYFNPRAVSKKGALGLMQIMPQNVRAFNISDPFDPRQNIMAGSRYFKSLLKRFNGELQLALAAYNAGPHVVEHYQDIPPYQETKNYVIKVLKYFRFYKKASA